MKNILKKQSLITLCCLLVLCIFAGFVKSPAKTYAEITSIPANIEEYTPASSPLLNGHKFANIFFRFNKSTVLNSADNCLFKFYCNAGLLCLKAIIQENEITSLCLYISENSSYELCYSEEAQTNILFHATSDYLYFYIKTFTFQYGDSTFRITDTSNVSDDPDYGECYKLIEPTEPTPIQYLEIENGTIAIEANAYENETSLLSVTIPESVTSIGASAFAGCTSLTSITIEGVTPPTIGASAIPENVTSILVPYEAVDLYKATYTDLASKIGAIEAEAGENTILFKDGTIILTDLTQYGQTTLTLPEAPVKDGYTFVSWCSDVSLTTPVISGATIEGNTTYYANYELITTQFNVTNLINANYFSNVCSSTKTVIDATSIKMTATEVNHRGVFSLRLNLEDVAGKSFLLSFDIEKSNENTKSRVLVCGVNSNGGYVTGYFDTINDCATSLISFPTEFPSTIANLRIYTYQNWDNGICNIGDYVIYKNMKMIDISSLVSNYAELEAQKNSLQNQLNDLEELKDMINDDYLALHESYEELEDLYNSAMNDNAGLNNQISNLQAQITSLNNQISNLQAQINAVRYSTDLTTSNTDAIDLCMLRTNTTGYLNISGSISLAASRGFNIELTLLTAVYDPTETTNTYPIKLYLYGAVNNANKLNLEFPTGVYGYQLVDDEYRFEVTIISQEEETTTAGSYFNFEISIKIADLFNLMDDISESIGIPLDSEIIESADILTNTNPRLASLQLRTSGTQTFTTLNQCRTYEAACINENKSDYDSLKLIYDAKVGEAMTYQNQCIILNNRISELQAEIINLNKEIIRLQNQTVVDKTVDDVSGCFGGLTETSIIIVGFAVLVSCIILIFKGRKQNENKNKR